MRTIAIILIGLIVCKLPAQSTRLVVTENTLHATYLTLTKLTGPRALPLLKARFESSRFNRPSIVKLLHAFDTLQMAYGFSFDQYPTNTKAPFSTEQSIERNLIMSQTLSDFEKISYGLLPPEDMKVFVSILDSLQPLYQSLILDTEGEKFHTTIASLKKYMLDHSVDSIVTAVAGFYGVRKTLPHEITIAVYPCLIKGGFSAKAFLNAGVCEVPPGMKFMDVLVSVLLHEMFHVMYDAQPLNTKVQLNNSFSKTDTYAKHLLDEVLATALGNGYAFTRLTGKIDTAQWYDDVYINAMAKKFYAVIASLKGDAFQLSPINLKQYCADFQLFANDWLKQNSFILKYRYVVSDQAHNARYFRQLVPLASMTIESYPIDDKSLVDQSQSPLTKVVVIGQNHKQVYKKLYALYPELKKERVKLYNDSSFRVPLNDGTLLLIYTPDKYTLEKLI